MCCHVPPFHVCGISGFLLFNGIWTNSVLLVSHHEMGLKPADIFAMTNVAWKKMLGVF